MSKVINSNERQEDENDFAVALLEKVKNALRRPPNMDDELMDIIDACKDDLALAGVCRIVANDPLIKRAVILYAKANFSFSADGGKFQQAYDTLKNSLRLAGDRRV